jgi:hypothetical protein
VLFLGSGSAVHSLRKMGPTGSPAPQWAAEFDTWLEDSLLSGRYEDVNRYEEKAPYAKVAHPWPDHFYPLHVVPGAAGDGCTAELIRTNASLSPMPHTEVRHEHLMGLILLPSAVGRTRASYSRTSNACDTSRSSVSYSRLFFFFYFGLARAFSDPAF